MTSVGNHGTLTNVELHETIVKDDLAENSPFDTRIVAETEQNPAIVAAVEHNLEHAVTDTDRRPR